MFCQMRKLQLCFHSKLAWMIHKENFTLEEITLEDGILDATRATCWDNAINHTSSCIPFPQNSKVRS